MLFAVSNEVSISTIVLSPKSFDAVKASNILQYPFSMCTRPYVVPMIFIVLESALVTGKYSVPLYSRIRTLG